MSLGAEFAELVQDLMTDFGSLLTWQHVVRVENANLGSVSTSTSDEAFRGAVVDPMRAKVFSDDAVARATTAVLIPGGSLTTDPKLEDKVALQPGRYLTVLELKAIYGPGDAGPPVLIAHLAAVVG